MTQDQHLLMDDLQPFAMYTCRVAAYTVKRGPFSQPLTIVLSSGMLKPICLHRPCVINALHF